ncbi:Uncharacterized protein BP5553_07984 [Venustampulla echinocandica]|uniref:Tyrosyl-DNA phosphodiesterase n=1 Tax=Venustampulla echinocandica TaxID=2656787 RepID=A0A370TFE5_9HELO|nr:Uncharacterized protein BP5553_07984 [Venustampulla echinocandica]RDL33616.1 Uncharacterized protein BP5553_07984 [Venustampulla echinocandica]
MEDTHEEPPRKRRRLSSGDDYDTDHKDRNLPMSLASSISPPPARRPPVPQLPKVIPSPFQLTWVRDLPASSNVDAVSLKDILGDPLIAECWEFNYLHDLDFLMEAFDNDVRDLVKVHVVHGFWKSEDPSRQALQLQAAKYANITLHTAYMPEMFGTHHSKMLILLRHDACAQVIIHTANMIPFDWTNMTQAIWKSPILPELPSNAPPESVSSEMGSGCKFKTDLLNYLKAYDGRRTICKPLIQQLSKYDFSTVRAALVASVPARQGIETDSETTWGWPGLRTALSSVPVKGNEPEIVVQISSIGTLGPTDKWLDNILFATLNTSKNGNKSKSKFHIVFPTPDEIRRSLNGYRSGSAIHLKILSAAQAKQLQYLKPLLYHWARDAGQNDTATSEDISDAGRKRAAPHIKTYVRYADKTRSSIDWMLVTSANMSKQAWGDPINASGKVRICSYEIGVLVWPELFGEGATMVPTFKTDMPKAESDVASHIVVGARIPYDLPLLKYGEDDEPWCATASYTKPDVGKLLSDY